MTSNGKAVEFLSSGSARPSRESLPTRTTSSNTTLAAFPLPLPSNFPPARPDEVERRPSSAHMANMLKEPQNSDDHSNEFFLAINRQCRNAQNHAMGVFCLDCRGIPMPWAQNLPEVHDDRGNRIIRGSSGSILDGVRLNSLTAIATLSTVAYLDVTGQPQVTIDGLANLESRYPASARAGRLISRLWRSLSNLADDQDTVPHFYDLILRALMNPSLSETALGETFLSMPDTGATSSRQSKAIVNGRVGSQGTGGRHGQETVESSPTPMAQVQSPGGPSGEEGSGENSEGDESMDEEDDEEEEDVENTDDAMPAREKKSGHQFNRPAKRRPWEFVPGTDLTPAELGKPDPSKFFLLRQNKNNPLEKDIRQYPRWEKFDWDSKKEIDSLNRHRRQIKSRTCGITHEPRLPWTQMEHDVLKDLVDQAIQSGKDRLSINWDEISHDMSRRFENVIQNPGQAMAQTTDYFEGKVLPPKGQRNTLKSTRKGAPTRKGTAVKNQAEKFGDIYKMLIDSKPLANKGPKRKRPGEQPADLGNTTDDTASPSVQKARPKRVKRVYKGPKDMLDQGPKPPGPSPPPGGAGGVAGPVGDGGWDALDQTAFPAH